MYVCAKRILNAFVVKTVHTCRDLKAVPVAWS